MKKINHDHAHTSTLAINEIAIKKNFHLTLSLLVTFVIANLAGCADLAGVRDFAKKSASLTSGTEAVTYWKSGDERYKPLKEITNNLNSQIYPAQPCTPSTNEVKSVLGLQTVLTAYMSALGDLADDSLPDVSKQISGIVTSINKLPIPTDANLTSAQIKQKTADVNAAYGALGNILKLPLEAYQNYKVRTLIKDNATHVQRIIDGLQLTARVFQQCITSERGNITNWYNLNNATYPAGSPSFIGLFKITETRSNLLQSYNNKYKALDSYTAALTTINDEHKKLVDGITVFDTATLKRTLSSLATAGEEISQARDKYLKAFEN